MDKAKLQELNSKLQGLNIIRVEDGVYGDQVNLVLGKSTAGIAARQELFLLECGYSSGYVGHKLTDLKTGDVVAEN